MKLQDIISISFDVLENLILEEVKKIPGISVQNIQTIKINDKECSIDIYITPFNLLANIYSIASELQSAINWYMCKQFDLDEGQVKINIIVKPAKGVK